MARRFTPRRRRVRPRCWRTPQLRLAQNKTPAVAGGGFDSERRFAYGADDEVVSSSDEDGAIGVSEEIGAIGLSEDDDTTGAAEDDETTGASDEDDTTGAALDEETTAEDDGGVTTTGVVVPRLKTKIRPMITITATMMIIQVLRFMRVTLCWRRGDRGGLS